MTIVTKNCISLPKKILIYFFQGALNNIAMKNHFSKRHFCTVTIMRQLISTIIRDLRSFSRDKSKPNATSDYQLRNNNLVDFASYFYLFVSHSLYGFLSYCMVSPADRQSDQAIFVLFKARKQKVVQYCATV